MNLHEKSPEIIAAEEAFAWGSHDAGLYMEAADAQADGLKEYRNFAGGTPKHLVDAPIDSVHLHRNKSIPEPEVGTYLSIPQ